MTNPNKLPLILAVIGTMFSALLLSQPKRPSRYVPAGVTIH